MAIDLDPSLVVVSVLVAVAIVTVGLRLSALPAS